MACGRNAVREALRGPRTVGRVWATKNALREPWLTACRRSSKPQAQRRSPHLRLAGARRMRRRVGLSVRRGGVAAWCASGSWWRSIRSRTLRTWRHLPLRRVRWHRGDRRSPSAARPRWRPMCKGVRGRGARLPVAQFATCLTSSAQARNQVDGAMEPRPAPGSL